MGVLLGCVYCTKLAPIFKIMFGELSPFHHATASAPQHARGRAVPLLLCRPALAYTLPMLLLFSRDFDFLFRYGRVQARDGFLLEGRNWRNSNTDSVLPKLFSGEKDLAKPRLNFPPAERGLGNEYGRVSLSDFSAAAMDKKDQNC